MQFERFKRERRCCYTPKIDSIPTMIYRRTEQQTMVSYSMYIFVCTRLTLNAPRATKVVCFSRLLFSSAEMFKKPLWQTVWTQIWVHAPRSGSTLFVSFLNSSVMLGSYLQQTASADDIFRCIFLLGALGLILMLWTVYFAL